MNMIYRYTALPDSTIHERVPVVKSTPATSAGYRCFHDTPPVHSLRGLYPHC